MFWIAPSVMIALGASGTASRDCVQRYLEVCLGMANYRRNLQRYSFAGADHLVVQFVPPPTGTTVLDRLGAGLS